MELPQPGERFALHASHVRNDKLAYDWYGIGAALDRECPKSAILAIIEVRKCVERVSARPSKFDAPNVPTKRKKKEYAILVKTIEKMRKPIECNPPMIRPPVWYWEEQ